MARAKKQRSKKPRGAKAAARSRKPAKTATRAAAIAVEVVDCSPEIEVAPQVSDAQLVLPDCLDSDASVAVRDTLLQRRGQPLLVDASQVRRVGAQSLQILIAAARLWQADGQSYAVTNPSSELLETMALIGLPQTELLLEGRTS